MSKAVRGGGAHKKPVLDMIENEFGEKPFTLAEIQATVNDICRALLPDLINSGDVKAVKVDGRKAHYPLVYQLVGKNDTVVKRR
jgi:hypothetical protein